MSGPPPGGQRIDRAALERIMQRAAELQAGEADVGEGLTPDEVVALGRDVGIPGRYLQQAMLEESTAVVAPAQAGVLAAVVGPAEVSAHRVVVGDPEDAARALIGWFDKHELLVVQRQQTGRVTWEPLKGMTAALRQAGAVIGGGKPKYMLANTTLVSATFLPLEAGYCHVQLTASLREARGGYVGLAAAAGSLGLAGAAVIAALTPLWPVGLLPLGFGAALGWFGLRRYRPLLDRARLGLERALDFLERGGVKPAHQLPPRGPSLLETLAGELKKALAAPEERKRLK